MSNVDIIKAWKDENYRNNLSSSEQELLPENPAGTIELSGSEMEDIDGGSTSWVISATFAVTASLCYSISRGGTCPVWGFGC